MSHRSTTGRPFLSNCRHIGPGVQKYGGGVVMAVDDSEQAVVPSGSVRFRLGFPLGSDAGGITEPLCAAYIKGVIFPRGGSSKHLRDESVVLYSSVLTACLTSAPREIRSRAAPQSSEAAHIRPVPRVSSRSGSPPWSSRRGTPHRITGSRGVINKVWLRQIAFAFCAGLQQNFNPVPHCVDGGQ